MGGTCSRCSSEFEGGWWYHVIYDCTELASVSDTDEWDAFVSLLRSGHAALAMYACFPLFA